MVSPELLPALGLIIVDTGFFSPNPNPEHIAKLLIHEQQHIQQGPMFGSYHEAQQDLAEKTFDDRRDAMRKVRDGKCCTSAGKWKTLSLWGAAQLKCEIKDCDWAHGFLGK